MILEAESPTPRQPIGKNWVAGFIRRRPEIKSRLARKYNYQRAMCENPKVIFTWFEQLQKVKDKWGILDEDIYNFDENGFVMELIATTR
jgi:hypothetical protein